MIKNNMKSDFNKAMAVSNGQESRKATLYVQTKFQHGEEEIKQKKGIAHKEAKKRLHKWKIYRGSGNVFADIGVANPEECLACAKSSYALKARKHRQLRNMTWHYIPVRYKSEDGTWVYTVQEFYGKFLHTADKHGISAMGESKKELIRDLEMMLNDLKKRPTKTVKMKDTE